jgi:hypothetical protein
MTKKLEELFDIPGNKDFIDEEKVQEAQEENIKSYEKKLAKAEEVESVADQVDKISSALPRVSGLGAQSDKELNDIAERALDSYEQLMDLGMNAELRYSGRIFEVAGTMLKTGLDAKVAKLDKKVKMIDLQLRKQKLDQSSSEPADTVNGDDLVIDRNALLDTLKKIDK